MADTTFENILILNHLEGAANNGAADIYQIEFTANGQNQMGFITFDPESIKNFTDTVSEVGVENTHYNFTVLSNIEAAKNIGRYKDSDFTNFSIPYEQMLQAIEEVTPTKDQVFFSQVPPAIQNQLDATNIQITAVDCMPNGKDYGVDFYTIKFDANGITQKGIIRLGQQDLQNYHQSLENNTVPTGNFTVFNDIQSAIQNNPNVQTRAISSEQLMPVINNALTFRQATPEELKQIEEAEKTQAADSAKANSADDSIAYKRAKGALKEFVQDRELNNQEAQSLLDQAGDGKETDFAIIQKHHQKQAENALNNKDMDAYNKHSMIAGKAGLIDQKIKNGDFTKAGNFAESAIDVRGQFGTMTKDLMQDIEALENNSPAVDKAKQISQAASELNKSAAPNQPPTPSTLAQLQKALGRNSIDPGFERDSSTPSRPDNGFSRNNPPSQFEDKGFHGPNSNQSQADFKDRINALAKQFIEMSGQTAVNVTNPTGLTNQLAQTVNNAISKDRGRG